MDWKLINVILLGLGFMLIFTAFQTTSMCSKLVTSSLKHEIKLESEEFEVQFQRNFEDSVFMKPYSGKNGEELTAVYIKEHSGQNLTNEFVLNEIIKDDMLNSMYGNGYISLSLLYAIFALANFFSAAVVDICGHKLTMFVAGLTYLNFICMFLMPIPSYMYISSVIIGIGAACIWTAQGAFLHLQSPTPQLMSRNTGIFWCMLQFSLIFGNIYIFFAWSGKEYVSSAMRTTLFTGFAILATIGCLVFLGLRPEAATADHNETEIEKLDTDASKNAVSANKNTNKMTTIILSIKASFLLLATKNMILLTSLFLYSGFVLSFFSGVYPTAIGNSGTMPNAMAIVGLNGVFIGIGEVLGGGMFVFGSKIMNKVPTNILLIACIGIHNVAFVLAMLNLQIESNMRKVEEGPCIIGCILSNSNQYLALLTALLLGLGDAGVNNVIYTTISTIWKDNSASAFALMKCLQSSACAISFAIASKINIFWNISILAFFASLTCVTYVLLMKANPEKFKKTETTIKS